MKALLSRSKDRSPHHSSVNKVMLARVIFIVTVVILLFFGLVMVYSASSIVALSETGDPSYYFKRQLVFVALGLALAIGLAFVHYRVPVGKASWLFWGIVVVLLVATLIYGATGLGAKRWFPIGSFTVQPSELVKIAFIFISVYLITRWHESGTSSKLLLQIACGLLVPAALILLQPDLGTILVALIGVLAIMWLGGLPKRLILLSFGAILLFGIIAVIVEPFRIARIMASLNPWADPLDSGYQAINSLYAFGEGGVTGVGLGQSHQKYLFIPEPQNDFVFAIIGEELGLIGAGLTVLLFLILIIAGFMIARHAADNQGRMIAGAATVLIGAQAFLNILCVIGVLPITGKPLPFFSAGGSSMISTMLLVGLILSVSFHTDARDAAVRRRDNLLILEGGAQQGRRPQEVPSTMVASRQRVASGGSSRAVATGSRPATGTRAVPLSLASISLNRTGLAAQMRDSGKVDLRARGANTSVGASSMGSPRGGDLRARGPNVTDLRPRGSQMREVGPRAVPPPEQRLRDSARRDSKAPELKARDPRVRGPHVQELKTRDPRGRDSRSFGSRSIDVSQRKTP